MLGDCLPKINFSLKVSVELSTAKSLIEAQNLKITTKSGRSRVVDSPPMTLQTVVVVWSSNIAYNARGLPQFGYLMLCQPGDDAIKERNFDEKEKGIAKRSYA